MLRGKQVRQRAYQRIRPHRSYESHPESASQPRPLHTTNGVHRSLGARHVDVNQSPRVEIAEYKCIVAGERILAGDIDRPACAFAFGHPGVVNLKVQRRQSNASRTSVPDAVGLPNTGSVIRRPSR